MRQFIDQETINDGTDINKRPKIKKIRPRIWKIFIDELPIQAINKLNTNGEITIGPEGDYTWTQVRNYIKKIKDNSLAPSNL